MRPLICLIDLLLATLVGGFVYAGTEQLTVSVEGGSFAGTLSTVEQDGTVHLQDGDTLRSIPFRDFVSWGAQCDVERGPVIVLSDGSLLRSALGFRLEQKTLELNSEIWKSIGIPRTRVRGVLLKIPWSQPHRDEALRQIVEFDGIQDQVLLENGDVIRGTVTIEGEKIRIESGNHVVSIELHRAQSMSFRRSSLFHAQTAATWLVGLRDGSALRCGEMILGRDRSYVELDVGLRLNSAGDVNLLDKICSLRAFNHRVVYLSDMKPIGYRHVPTLDLKWPYRENQSVLGGRLRCRGQMFSKGLGLHSTSSIAYRLAESYLRFEADVCIDDRSGRRGSVICRVYSDDGSGWRLVHETSVMRGGDPIRRLSVELNNVLRLSLIVDRADQGDEWDHVNWLNARLVKSN